jgi:zinc transport system substrate-binding protein
MAGISSMYRNILIIVVFLLLLPRVSGAEGPVHVFASILPEKNFIEKVGGGKVDVTILLPPGRSPATYTPTPAQMAALSHASIYFSIGVPFEKALLPKLRHEENMPEIVDITAGIARRGMTTPDLRGEPDPHVWLAPENVRIMAGNILDALSRLDPGNRKYYSENCMRFRKELDLLDKKLKKILAPFKGRKIYVFHPAFGYFASAYGMEQVAVETGGSSPSPRHIAELIRMARRDRVRTIFVQPQFPSKSARTIADAIGGSVVPVDPLAEDYIGNMERLAGRMASSLEKP